MARSHLSLVPRPQNLEPSHAVKILGQLLTFVKNGLGLPCQRVDRRILQRNVAFSNPTTEELLKRAEDMMREDWEYLKDFNAAIDRLQQRQAEFQAERYS